MSTMHNLNPDHLSSADVLRPILPKSLRHDVAENWGKSDSRQTQNGGNTGAVRAGGAGDTPSCRPVPRIAPRTSPGLTSSPLEALNAQAEPASAGVGSKKLLRNRDKGADGANLLIASLNNYPSRTLTSSANSAAERRAAASVSTSPALPNTSSPLPKPASEAGRSASVSNGVSSRLPGSGTNTPPSVPQKRSVRSTASAFSAPTRRPLARGSR